MGRDTLGSFTSLRAGAILLVYATVTLAALAQIMDPLTGQLLISVDPSIDRMLPKDDEARRYYDHVRRLFGSDESVLVALVGDDVFSAENLARLTRMTRRLETLGGVHHVVGLTTALDIRADGEGDSEGLVIAPFLEEPPADAQGREELRRRVMANPVYRGSLVSERGDATLLSIHLRDVPERGLIESGLARAIERVVEEEWDGQGAWLCGGLYTKAEHSRIMLEDLSRTVPFAVLAAMLVAFVSFRSIRGVLIPTATTLISVTWTLGFISAVGTPLNLLTIIIPTLLFVVGFAYAIHIVSEYYDVLAKSERSNRRRVQSVSLALRSVAKPVILTGVTTIAGVLALTLSPIPAIKQFGAFSALGIAITVLVSLTFAPAVLALLPEPSRIRDRAAGGLFDRWVDSLADFTVRRRAPILALGAVVALASVMGLTRIRVNTEFVDPGTSLYESAMALGEYLQGANSFQVVFETDYDGAFKEPGNLRQIELFQGWLDAQPEIGGTTSLVDFLELISRGFHGGDPDAMVIPDSRSLISQLFFFGANDELERFVDSKYQTTSIQVRSGVNDSDAMAQLVSRIEARAAELPVKMRATVTGNTVLVARTLDDIARGQAVSLGLAFLMILAVLSVLFMSIRVGLLALIPNALPVLFYFGILGWLGITLNATTGLVACLVLGVAVDDTIHLLARFNDAAKRTASEVRGMREALRSVGRPVTYTTAALCMGFLTLTQSQLHNQAQFGALAAATLAFAWLVDMTFTPALASWMRIVSLWDVLTLDLGEAPHLSIPLFSGLRETQARIVALMTSIIHYPKGHRLFAAGEVGAEMYVVIEGQLVASLNTGQSTVRFHTHERGEVLGEVGFFHGTRTADVTAESDVRLLCLTRKDVERISRHYPKIGARLYANLSEILAERVATTTDKVR